jgi:hypothetical protein
MKHAMAYSGVPRHLTQVGEEGRTSRLKMSTSLAWQLFGVLQRLRANRGSLHNQVQEGISDPRQQHSRSAANHSRDDLEDKIYHDRIKQLVSAWAQEADQRGDVDRQLPTIQSYSHYCIQSISEVGDVPLDEPRHGAVLDAAESVVELYARLCLSFPVLDPAWSKVRAREYLLRYARITRVCDSLWPSSPRHRSVCESAYSFMQCVSLDVCHADHLFFEQLEAEYRRRDQPDLDKLRQAMGVTLERWETWHSARNLGERGREPTAAIVLQSVLLLAENMKRHQQSSTQRKGMQMYVVHERALCKLLTLARYNEEWIEAEAQLNACFVKRKPFFTLNDSGLLIAAESAKACHLRRFILNNTAYWRRARDDTDDDTPESEEEDGDDEVVTFYSWPLLPDGHELQQLQTQMLKLMARKGTEAVTTDELKGATGWDTDRMNDLVEKALAAPGCVRCIRGGKHITPFMNQPIFMFHRGTKVGVVTNWDNDRGCVELSGPPLGQTCLNASYHSPVLEKVAKTGLQMMQRRIDTSDDGEQHPIENRIIAAFAGYSPLIKQHFDCVVTYKTDEDKWKLTVNLEEDARALHDDGKRGFDKTLHEMQLDRNRFYLVIPMFQAVDESRKQWKVVDLLFMRPDTTGSDTYVYQLWSKRSEPIAMRPLASLLDGDQSNGGPLGPAHLEYTWRSMVDPWRHALRLPNAEPVPHKPCFVTMRKNVFPCVRHDGSMTVRFADFTESKALKEHNDHSYLGRSHKQCDLETDKVEGGLYGVWAFDFAVVWVTNRNRKRLHWIHPHSTVAHETIVCDDNKEILWVSYTGDAIVVILEDGMRQQYATQYEAETTNPSEEDIQAVVNALRLMHQGTPLNQQTPSENVNHFLNQDIYPRMWMDPSMHDASLDLSAELQRFQDPLLQRICDVGLLMQHHFDVFPSVDVFAECMSTIILGRVAGTDFQRLFVLREPDNDDHSLAERLTLWERSQGAAPVRISTNNISVMDHHVWQLLNMPLHRGWGHLYTPAHIQHSFRHVNEPGLVNYRDTHYQVVPQTEKYAMFSFMEVLHLGDMLRYLDCRKIHRAWQIQVERHRAHCRRERDGKPHRVIRGPTISYRRARQAVTAAGGQAQPLQELTTHTPQGVISLYDLTRRRDNKPPNMTLAQKHHQGYVGVRFQLDETSPPITTTHSFDGLVEVQTLLESRHHPMMCTRTEVEVGQYQDGMPVWIREWPALAKSTKEAALTLRLQWSAVSAAITCAVVALLAEEPPMPELVAHKALILLTTCSVQESMGTMTVPQTEQTSVVFTTETKQDVPRELTVSSLLSPVAQGRQVHLMPQMWLQYLHGASLSAVLKLATSVPAQNGVLSDVIKSLGLSKEADGRVSWLVVHNAVWKKLSYCVNTKKMSVQQWLSTTSNRLYPELAKLCEPLQGADVYPDHLSDVSGHVHYLKWQQDLGEYSHFTQATFTALAPHVRECLLPRQPSVPQLLALLKPTRTDACWADDLVQTGRNSSRTSADEKYTEENGNVWFEMKLALMDPKTDEWDANVRPMLTLPMPMAVQHTHSVWAAVWYLTWEHSVLHQNVTWALSIPTMMLEGDNPVRQLQISTPERRLQMRWLQVLMAATTLVQPLGAEETQALTLSTQRRAAVAWLQNKVLVGKMTQADLLFALLALEWLNGSEMGDFQVRKWAETLDRITMPDVRKQTKEQVQLDHKKGVWQVVDAALHRLGQLLGVRKIKTDYSEEERKGVRDEPRATRVDEDRMAPLFSRAGDLARWMEVRGCLEFAVGPAMMQFVDRFPQNKAFRGLRKFARRERTERAGRLEKARQHSDLKDATRAFKGWSAVHQHEKSRRETAETTVKSSHNSNVLRTSLDRWRKVSKARKLLVGYIRRWRERDRQRGAKLRFLVDKYVLHISQQAAQSDRGQPSDATQLDQKHVAQSDASVTHIAPSDAISADDDTNRPAAETRRLLHILQTSHEVAGAGLENDTASTSQGQRVVQMDSKSGNAVSVAPSATDSTSELAALQQLVNMIILRLNGLDVHLRNAVHARAADGAAEVARITSLTSRLDALDAKIASMAEPIANGSSTEFQTLISQFSQLDGLLTELETHRSGCSKDVDEKLASIARMDAFDSRLAGMQLELQSVRSLIGAIPSPELVHALEERLNAMDTLTTMLQGHVDSVMKANIAIIENAGRHESSLAELAASMEQLRDKVGAAEDACSALRGVVDGFQAAQQEMKELVTARSARDNGDSDRTVQDEEFRQQLATVVNQLDEVRQVLSSRTTNTDEVSMLLTPTRGGPITSGTYVNVRGYQYTPYPRHERSRLDRAAAPRTQTNSSSATGEESETDDHGADSDGEDDVVSELTPTRVENVSMGIIPAQRLDFESPGDSGSLQVSPSTTGASPQRTPYVRRSSSSRFNSPTVSPFKFLKQKTPALMTDNDVDDGVVATASSEMSVLPVKDTELNGTTSKSLHLLLPLQDLIRGGLAVLMRDVLADMGGDMPETKMSGIVPAETADAKAKLFNAEFDKIQQELPDWLQTWVRDNDIRKTATNTPVLWRSIVLAAAVVWYIVSLKHTDIRLPKGCGSVRLFSDWCTTAWMGSIENASIDAWKMVIIRFFADGLIKDANFQTTLGPKVVRGLETWLNTLIQMQNVVASPNRARVANDIQGELMTEASTRSNKPSNSQQMYIALRLAGMSKLSDPVKYTTTRTTNKSLLNAVYVVSGVQQPDQFVSSGKHTNTDWLRVTSLHQLFSVMHTVFQTLVDRENQFTYPTVKQLQQHLPSYEQVRVVPELLA